MCHHHKFGFCKFKQQCLKEHVETECEALSACKEIKSCRKRHPKTCRRFSLENFCQFGERCSYVHVARDHNKVAFNKIVEDMNNIKAELDLLKNTVKSLSEIKKEGKVIKKSIEGLKAEIVKIKAENLQIVMKVKSLEEDMETETDDNSDSDETDINDRAEVDEVLSCIYCKTQFSKIKYFKSHMESHEGDDIIKCLKCLYSCANKLTLQKHMNTKHPFIDSGNNDKVPEEDETDNDCDIEEDQDIYDIEMVNGEPVWACNLCSDALESQEEMIIHMQESHNRVVNDNDEVVASCKDGNCAESTNVSCIECIYKQWDY